MELKHNILNDGVIGDTWAPANSTRTGMIVGAGEDRSGLPYLLVEAGCKPFKAMPRPGDFSPAPPRRIEIRTKEYDFLNAPELDGITAWYQADGAFTRHRRAIDAAREAARLDYSAHGFFPGGRSAYVTCMFGGERPSGAPRHSQYVSYRVRY